MAEIKFTGFVDDWRRADHATGAQAQSHPAWGMKVSETHSKKVGDDYIQNGVTRRTVKAGWNKETNSPAEIDFTQFKTGDRVDVVGVEVSESWESNGRKGSSLVVKATSVTLAAHSARRTSKVAEETRQNVAEVISTVFADDSEAPF